MAKLVLNYTAIEEELFDDTVILGIISGTDDFHFCWHLNNALNFDFCVNNEMELEIKGKKQLYYYRVFEYKEPLSSIRHLIFNNRSSGEYLLPELKHIDYIWKIDGFSSLPFERFQLIQSIVKQLPIVRHLSSIEPEQIKHKQNLFY
jgi:hypothetical protein